jgi:cytochrome c oxidase subunit 3
VARSVIATAVLVSSSFTMIAADRALEHGDRVRARRWLLATIGLGGAFLVNQLLEYASLEFGADSHPYGSVFWLLTGLHGLHITAGLAALLLVFVRTIRARDHRTMLPFATGVSVYWHLVDVVWIGVFLTIWVIQ